MVRRCLPGLLGLGVVLSTVGKLHAQTPLVVDAPPPPPLLMVEEAAPVERHWIGVGILLGWSQRSQLPEVFSNPLTGDPLLAPRQQKAVVAAGITLQGGWHFGDRLQHGIDASFLSIGDWYESRLLFAPVLPFVDARAEFDTEYTSGDVNYRHRLHEANGLRVDGLIGFRSAGLWDRTRVTTALSDGTSTPLRWRNGIEAWNGFNGGQIGLAGTLTMGDWLFNATGKIAFGNTHSEITFFGTPTFYAIFPSEVLLYSDDRFAVLPSASLMISRRIGTRSRFYVGYELQVLTNVARSAHAFQDTQPEFKSTFWTQGVTLGFEWRW